MKNIENAKNIITIGDMQFAGCTAVATGCEDDGRQPGIFAHYVGDEFGDGDGVYFGAYMPETEEEVKALLEEYCDTACLESVEF